MKPVRCASCQAFHRRVRELQAENERLRRQLDPALRAGKRQAGSFAKGLSRSSPRQPGRKPGKDYGTKAHCFEDARHQQWLSHLLRRADEMAATAT
jgi:hypothetical protein